MKNFLYLRVMNILHEVKNLVVLSEFASSDAELINFLRRNDAKSSVIVGRGEEEEEGSFLSFLESTTFRRCTAD